MTYEILSRREIPLTETVRGLITGKTITYPLGKNRQAAEYAENRQWAESAAERNFGA